MGSARKANGLNIGKRLRSIGYQPPAPVTSGVEPTSEALPANTNAEGDGLVGLSENKSSVAGEPEPSLANEDVNSAPRWALLLNEGTDRYLLRGLLWCGLCDEPFACCLMSTGIRYYGCTNIVCTRALVNAEEAEQVVWKGFVLKHEDGAVAVKRNERQAALHEALVRVTVHSGASDMSFEWRE